MLRMDPHMDALTQTLHDLFQIYRSDEDAVQEACVSLLGRGRDVREPGAYLRRAAASRRVDSLRRAEREKRRRRPIVWEQIENHSPTPLDALIEDEAARRLWSQVMTLPPGQRQAIESKLQGVAFSRSNLAKAKTNLRKSIAATEGESRSRLTWRCQSRSPEKLSVRACCWV
jgi:DNA-directed RNA polymerase specialized sigma24 family protein